MPLFDYQCPNCKTLWESLDPINAPPGAECPECGARSADRLVSGHRAVQLKGPGWAKDGYSGAGNKRR